MTRIKFDVVKYKKLLDFSESNDIEDPKFLEFLRLGISVDNQVQYNHRSEYLSLFENYLTGKIDSGVFQTKFIKTVHEHYETSCQIFDNLDELENFWIDSESTTVASILYKVYDLCTDQKEEEESGLFWSSPTTLDDWVAEAVANLQKYFETNKDEPLTNYFFNWLMVHLYLFQKIIYFFVRFS